MLDKVAHECLAENKHRISDAIEQLFGAAREIISRSEFNNLRLFSDTKLLYDLAHCTVTLFNKRHGYRLRLSIKAILLILLDNSNNVPLY